MHEIQPSFDLTEPEHDVTTPVEASLRDTLVEQVIRDTLVLAEDEIYHAPSREFYEQRIESYKQEIAARDETKNIKAMGATTE